MKPKEANTPLVMDETERSLLKNAEKAPVISKVVDEMTVKNNIGAKIMGMFSKPAGP